MIAGEQRFTRCGGSAQRVHEGGHEHHAAKAGDDRRTADGISEKALRCRQKTDDCEDGHRRRQNDHVHEQPHARRQPRFTFRQRFSQKRPAGEPEAEPQRQRKCVGGCARKLQLWRVHNHLPVDAGMQRKENAAAKIGHEIIHRHQRRIKQQQHRDLFSQTAAMKKQQIHEKSRHCKSDAVPFFGIDDRVGQPATEKKASKLQRPAAARRQKCANEQPEDQRVAPGQDQRESLQQHHS